MQANSLNKKIGQSVVEYAILLALVGVIVGMSIWKLSEDPELFRNLFASVFSNSTIRTKQGNSIKLEIPPMDR